jgi:hypothetical protein
MGRMEYSYFVHAKAGSALQLHVIKGLSVICIYLPMFSDLKYQLPLIFL